MSIAKSPPSTKSIYTSPSFYKFEKVHKISTNRIEIFGKTTTECLLSNNSEFIRVNDKPNIFVGV